MERNGRTFRGVKREVPIGSGRNDAPTWATGIRLLRSGLCGVTARRAEARGAVTQKGRDRASGLGPSPVKRGLPQNPNLTATLAHSPPSGGPPRATVTLK